MFRLRHTISLALAAAALVATTMAASAAPMRILRDHPVLESPTPGAPAKYSLHAGEVHDVNCGSTGWCFVDTPAGGGYIPWDIVEGASPPAPAGGSSAGNNNGPGFSLDFNFGNNNPPPRPGGGGGGRFEDDEVCFYTNSNFRGRSFCVEPGDASNRLSSNWNDNISSIEVSGDAEVEVCTDRNMRGTCATLDRDASRLSSRLNDRISSFEVY